MSSFQSPIAKSATAARPSFTAVPSPLLQRKHTGREKSSGSDEQAEEHKKKLERSHAGVLQRRAAASDQPKAVPPAVHQVLNSPGRPLDAATRAYMEPRFGHDFSGVRIHTDARAAESARAVNAHAYTVGNDIVFADGKYQPGHGQGRHLLAHELAHTVQQGGLQRRADGIAMDSPASSHLEHEADRAAHAVTSGGGSPVIAGRPAGPTLARAKDDIETKNISGRKPTSKTTKANLTHSVTPTGEANRETDNKGSTKTLEEFSIDPFYLPAEKGPAAFPIYQGMAAGGSLESTLELTGSGKTKTALWQERPPTDDLRAIWLQRVGWSGADDKTINDLWQRAGGESEFPKVNSPPYGVVTAQMDHIVELQVGGDNIPENIQALDPKPNQSSGGAIKSQLQALAQSIAGDNTLAGPETSQIKMRFTKVVQVGKPAMLPTTCPPPKNARSALAVEACAMKLKVTKSAAGGVAIARDNYPIAAGGRPPTNLRVPTTFASRADEKVPIKGDSENDAASTLIPGLLLNTLTHRPKSTAKPDLIEAQIDDRDKTRLPITLNEKAKPFNLDVARDGKLSLPKSLKGSPLGFTYKYLSPGTITSMSLNDNGGVDWAGQITPTAKFIPTLDVEYKNGELRLVAQIPEEKLKKHKLFGASITKAALTVTLSPFDVTGRLDFVFGDPNKPAGTGYLKLGHDDQGIVGTAKLTLNIPKVDTSEITIEYRGGTERDVWTGDIKIESRQIKLPYVNGGSIVAHVVSNNGVTSLVFDGHVTLELPHKRGTAEVGLKRFGNNWFLTGSAQLNLPKIDNFSAAITYDVAEETLTASVPAEDGKSPAAPVGFTITEDFKGTLDRLHVKIARGGAFKVSGAGGFTFKKGKAAGSVHVDLAEDGYFSGIGDVSYAISDNLLVNGKVEFNEKGKPKLRVSGTLTIKQLELMKAISDHRTLFDKDFSIPIPYASIGGVGLKAIFGVKLEADFNLGPIVVEPLIFSAGFNPLEDEPQLDLGASGELKVPASATLSASLSGGVKIDAFVAEVGGKITITGTITLKGGLFVPFSGKYSGKEFSVEMTPEARLNLLLGVALSATVWAKAGVGWLSTGVEKTWLLGKREVDTGLGFGIKAPISYSSKTGPKLPSLSSVEMNPPDFSKENLSRVADRLFGEAKGEPANA
jgi:hypothetical protein